MPPGLAWAGFLGSSFPRVEGSVALLNGQRCLVTQVHPLQGSAQGVPPTLPPHPAPGSSDTKSWCEQEPLPPFSDPLCPSSSICKVVTTVKPRTDRSRGGGTDNDSRDHECRQPRHIHGPGGDPTREWPIAESQRQLGFPAASGLQTSNPIGITLVGILASGQRVSQAVPQHPRQLPKHPLWRSLLPLGFGVGPV